MSVRWPRILTPTYLSQIIRSQKNPSTALQIFKEAKEKYPNYHHNGPVYETMIDILGESGRINEMKEVLDQMRDDSCECKDSVFARTIKTYARVGMVNEAVSLFKSIPQFNCINWTRSFHTLLRVMVNESKLENVYHLFLENSCGWEVRHRVYSLNILMHALCQRKCSHLALDVFQEMYCQGCHPDRDSYQILMRGLCDDGRMNEAIHLLYSMLWRISQKGSGEDVVIYRTLLDALCDHGQVEEAVEILNKILKKGLKAPKRLYNRLDVSRFDDIKDIEAVKHLINDTLVKGGVPNLASYTAMADDLYNENKIKQADKIVNEMQGKGYKPSNSTYEAKLTALCNEGKILEAIEVIEAEMVKANCVPTVRLYNVLLKGLCDTGDPTSAIGYLKKMSKQVGCVANKKTYTILVDGLCQNRRFEEASQVLEEMMRRSYRPLADTYNTLIKGLCSVGRCYEAVVWLEEMISQGMIPDTSLWNSLASSVCCNITENDVACETLQELSVLT